MSGSIFSSIDPSISGTALATLLNDFKDAMVSGNKGTSRPANLNVGGFWVDSTNDPTSWSFKIWTGTTDVEVFVVNLTTGVSSVALAVDSFIVKKITADANGALLDLVKRRIATNGQVLDGDTIGEIKFIGRANDASNPVVAKIVWVSSDNETTSAYGGELAFYSTPDASATITKHMRLVSGLVETIVPHKVNSQILVSQNVATAATIAQVNADTMVAEMTGSTATDIQGLNSAGKSQLVTIHNRSSVSVTLKHENAGASAADRIKLPNSVDFVIIAQASATLYYCVTDTRWKLKSTSQKVSGITFDTFYGATNSWTAPSTAARVRSYRKAAGAADESSAIIDPVGNAYAWGINTNGQLGVGDVTPRSSPIAVLGGLTLIKTIGVLGAAVSQFALSNLGAMYAWGINTSGQLGLGDVTPRSSPVAVLGGFRWGSMMSRDASTFGLSAGLALYAWGVNTNGQLGLGDVTPRSSPVAVLGGLKLAAALPISGAAGSSAVAALTSAGAAYAWGLNTNGNLGLGDVIPRSSPVAVLGGQTFTQLGGAAVSTRYFFNALTTAGAAYGWGMNTSGQLGVGDVTPRSSPVAVLGGLVFQQIITHPKSETVLGLTSAGVLYAWGDNTQGVLGVGDNNARSSPVAVLGGLTFKTAKLFYNMAAAITADGTLYTWGKNANGNLGVGDVVSRSSPVAVLGGLKFANVYFDDGSTDTYALLGMQADGTMYSWGVNTNGTLGLGDVTPRSSPVAVLGGLRADSLELVSSQDLTVAASTAYTISLNPGICTFGNIPIGQNIYKVEIEYLA